MTQVKKIFSEKYLSAIILMLLCYSLQPMFSQEKTILQGQIKRNDSSVFVKEKIFLMRQSDTTEGKISVDSTVTDTNGVFFFENFVYGDYSIGMNIAGIDNSVADIIEINRLNPAKRNQHFQVNDGSLLCIESNYSNIKDALENKENVYTLSLNSLQHDVAEKSLTIGTDGSKKLSPQIGEFTNLESLSMDINQIEFLPAETGNLVKLTVLNANLNKLSVLPNEMENLKNLKKLSLGKNNFSTFPELIAKYSSLEILNLENNPLTGLPVSISALKNLKELNLAGCLNIITLPVQIGELTSLEILNISNCLKLKSLPEELNSLKNLKMLDVTGTKVSVKKFQEAVPGCEIRK